MKGLIKKLLREGLNKLDDELNYFYNQVNLKHNNFLFNSFKNPNFELRLVDGGGVKNLNYGRPNKCETNVFRFIKDKMFYNQYHYYPVSGWLFSKSTSFFEHFWVYDEINDLFLEITPLKGDFPYAYGGVINKTINNDIYKANNFYDIDFLKGKADNSLYRNFEDQEPTPKLSKYISNNDTIDDKIFNFIKNNSEYSNLNNLLNSEFPNINSIKELKNVLKYIDNKLDKTKSSHEFKYFDELFDKTKAIIDYYETSSSTEKDFGL
jgi:hypothetical protein